MDDVQSVVSILKDKSIKWDKGKCHIKSTEIILEKYTSYLPSMVYSAWVSTVQMYCRIFGKTHKTKKHLVCKTSDITCFICHLYKLIPKLAFLHLCNICSLGTSKLPLVLHFPIECCHQTARYYLFARPSSESYLILAIFLKTERKTKVRAHVPNTSCLDWNEVRTF